MVKRQKERQYETTREHRSNQQIRSGRQGASESSKPLPFSSCALSLVNYTTPVISPRSNIIFENSAIFPFVLKHKMDPVNGQPLTTSDLIKLNMSKNDEGQWYCPITTKTFSEYTKILAVKNTVYSYEAYRDFNVKTGSFEDLVTGEPFDPQKDVRVLFDPQDPESRDMKNFYHIKHARELEQKNSGANTNINQNMTASRILDKLKKKQAERQTTNTDSNTLSKKRSAEEETGYVTLSGKCLKVLTSDVMGGIQYTDSAATSSLTSTGVQRHTDNRIREATREEINQSLFKVMRKRKRKGYVKLFINNTIQLVLELHCDMVPRTCVNFLGLCRDNKYDGSDFHRVISKFMMQGGKSGDDPTDDDSYFGGAFKDEFDDRLKHGNAGIVAMANSGPNTNKRQFYITFASAPHLDRKHSVFGNVMNPEVLKQFETIKTDKNNVPAMELKITKTEIVEDPVMEARKIEDERLEKLVEEREATSASIVAPAAKATGSKKTSESSVGRYLNLGQPKKEQTTTTVNRMPPPPKKTKFGNFSGW